MQAVTITQITAPELETLIVNSIKKVLSTQQAEQQTDPDRWLDLNEFCNYHPDKPSKATAYSWVSAGIAPVHKSGKKLRFLKSEIDLWLKEGRKKTSKEIEQEAEIFIKKRRVNNG